jgi:hypothetical protein
MSEKRHKSGYDILKERVADLENDVAFYRSQYMEVSKERDKLKEKLSMQIAPDFETFKRVERERDEWKAKYVKSLSDKEAACLNYAKEAVEQDKRIAFLLDHCPFWVRWMYRNQFEKGEKN